VNKTSAENWYQGYLADKILFKLLEKVDADLAKKVRQGRCLLCGAILHSARYRRKPRGIPKADFDRPEDIWRDSFCCAQEGCRTRHTPPSVRFLGRKVYWGFIVILISAMRNGLNAGRLKVLREVLGADRRTVERWREWWLKVFAESAFWKAARARFATWIDPATLPGVLCEAFGVERRDRLLDLLRFLSPITAGARVSAGLL
jgi:hypothetical protein